jgi:hypothetical protein
MSGLGNRSSGQDRKTEDAGELHGAGVPGQRVPPHGPPPERPPPAEPPSNEPPSGGRLPGPFADFNVLLDDPAEQPGLGFDDYAAALAEIIVHSRAEFAIGIFGSWGSGKTTLMRTVQAALARNPSVVPVWFTAWRYEKDPHLILPLLDVLREALEAEAEAEAEAPDRSGWARNAAAAVGRAGVAFLTGLQLSASLAGVGAGFDFSKMIDGIKNDHEDAEPLSYYHAGFTKLRAAIRGLSANGTRRVVIFVDDLDRCLPANALQVLESMKLFFDVEGCVFVVGLDERTAERAVAEKYRAAARPVAAGSEGASEPAMPDVSGTEYIKKLFQVPFTLPGIAPRRLPDYLDAIEQNSQFSDEQRQDFIDNVRPHFQLLPGRASVNPREIKRLINLYTLQLKILSPKLGDSLDRNVVLALLNLNFRRDWREFYEQLSADPQYFQRDLNDGLGEPSWPESATIGGARVPADLADYLRELGSCLLTADNLQAYVLAAEATWSTDPAVLDARMAVARLARLGAELAVSDRDLAEVIGKIEFEIEQLRNLPLTKRVGLSRRLVSIRSRIEAMVDQLVSVARAVAEMAGGPSGRDDAVTAWAEQAAPLVKSIDEALREWYRNVSLGA